MLASEAKILEPIASVYCRIDCDRVTNLVKYNLMLGGNERRPKGDAFGKRSFLSEARSAEKKKRQGMKLNIT